MKNRIHAFILIVALSIQLNGCFRWKSEFTETKPVLSAADAERLYIEAIDLAEKADDSIKLSKAVAAFEKVLEADPNNYDALAFLSTPDGHLKIP